MAPAPIQFPFPSGVYPSGQIQSYSTSSYIPADPVIKQSSILDDGVGGGHLTFVTQILSMFTLRNLLSI